MNTKLPYDNALALINAFKQGAKFKVVDSKHDGEVVSMRISQSGKNVSVKTHVNLMFRPDGTRHYTQYGGRLVRNESLGELLSRRLAADAPGTLMGTVTAKPALPFLQQYVTGSPAHCPKTREKVDQIKFKSGELIVEFYSEATGKYRKSTNYRHDGTHKHDAARNLVIGTAPPPADLERGTGRTTNLALAYVRELLDNAGEVVVIKDHFPSLSRYVEVTRVVRDILQCLGVQYVPVSPYSIRVIPLKQRG